MTRPIRRYGLVAVFALCSAIALPAAEKVITPYKRIGEIEDDLKALAGKCHNIPNTRLRAR